MKKVIIIGGGIAGLSAGCYAQMSGFSTEIFEMHSIPGGVCTSWKRGKYLFDHCLHWVLGSNKSTTLYPVFKELGVADKVDFHYSEIFRTIETDRRTFHAYTNIDRFEAELLKHFPDETSNIKGYIKLVKKYVRFNPPMDSDFGKIGLKDILKILPFIPSFLKLKRISIKKYLTKRFYNKELIEILFRLFPVTELPAIMTILPLSYMHRKEGGYPIGGSLNFARAIEKKYNNLGGKIKYNSKVRKIRVEKNKATGVELENGSYIPADIIIPACDGHATLFEMLEGKYLTQRIRNFYKHPKLWKPLISISLGVKRDFSAHALITDFKLKNPIQVCGETIEWSGFFHFCIDPNFAPKGHSVIKSQIETDYFYWKKLYDTDKRAYREEKERILNLYIDILDKKYPGLKNDIEERDIATPVTWERYTGNWQASYQGWLPTVSNFGVTLSKKLPGLKNVYMAGQWIFPGGGVPMCMVQARNLIRVVSSEQR